MSSIVTLCLSLKENHNVSNSWPPVVAVVVVVAVADPAVAAGGPRVLEDEARGEGGAHERSLPELGHHVGGQAVVDDQAQDRRVPTHPVFNRPGWWQRKMV